MRTKQLLDGLWDYRIGEGTFTKRKVPYSGHPVGESECALTFDTAEDVKGRRAFLVFEGITYSAEVYLNDKFLGTMYPYSEYKFEVGELLKQTQNRVSVKIFDIDVEFGPSEGWENYSGIIRSVYIEYTNQCIMDEVHWHTELNEDFSSAECYVDFKLDNSDTGAEFEAVLKNKNGVIVAEGKAKEDCVNFIVSHPELWSPDFPYLYTLECSVIQGGEICDFISQRVGFKEFIAKGKRFYLNGKPLFLLGLNRHDIYGEHGHTLTEEEMYKDMRMIKSTGVNYVRLVHYPHNKRILELADELGLLVSEEPGLWWSDVKNPEISRGALEVLKRVILRDRNHISVAFWLSFNECIFTLDFLKESAKVSRKYDPYRMVSGANCMSDEMTKENYPICGFDFYTTHPYAPTVDRMLDSAKALTEMPLLLTEWGGFFCYENPNLFNQYVDKIIECWNNPEDQPVIAGATYWFWAEMYELSRGTPACTGGILREGLVDIHRNPLPDLKVFQEAFSKMKYAKAEPNYEIQYEYKISAHGSFETVNLPELSSEDGENWERMVRDSKIPVKPYHNPVKSIRKMEYGPKVPCNIVNFGLMPVKLSKTPFVVLDEIEIKIDASAAGLYVVGNTSMPKGFPIGGTYGERVCEYIVEYADGTSEMHEMLNGRDITTATAQHGPSRINPVAETSPCLLKFNYDYNFEHYVINLHTIETDSSKIIRKFKIKNVNNGYNVLFYGVTIEK